MKAKLKDIWKYGSTLNFFFNHAGYHGKQRKHAEICVRCWIEHRLEGRHLSDMERCHYQKILKIRNAYCPHVKHIIIPWGRNRKYPPEGCKRLFEHSVVSGSNT